MKEEKFGRLNQDTAYYLKGTEFQILNEDDGMWSNNPFYAGRLDGRYVSFDGDKVNVIYDDSYTGKILPNHEFINSIEPEKEQWWQYVDYP